jgi:arylsulfatase A-like enzyme
VRGLRVAGALASLCAALACGGAPEPPRHLVLISLDTLRADRLGLHGYAQRTSPELDRWAERAFVFERALAPSNATIASHHALFQSRFAGAALADRDGAPTLAELLRQQGFRTVAFTGGGTMSREAGFARGFELWQEGLEDFAESVPRALRFLDEVARGDARAYLFVHGFDVHLPYDPPEPYASRFAPPGYAGPVTGPATLPLLRGVRRIFEQAHRASPPALDATDRARVSALYDAEIASMDAWLARLLARIDAADLRGDTLVAILSDHGEEFWEHGSVLHAHTLYQELLHVPLLLRVPGREARVRRIAERVSLLDVLPTLLELLEVPAPAELRGRSLVPLLDGEALPPQPLFAEGFAFDAKLQSVVDGEWKLIRELGSGRLELYDLFTDAGERNDLAARRPRERERLRALLDATLGTTVPATDPLAMPPRIEPATQERLRALGYVE